MDITLDTDLSEQLKSCKEGEAVTITGTVTSNQDGTVAVNVDTAMPSAGEETGEGGYGGTTEGESGAGMPMGMEAQPAIPGPVQTLLKRR